MQQENKTIGSPKISDMLLSNSPVSDPEGYQLYTEILDTKIQDPAVRNIGIIAPYGAGKSSLLETYKETVLKTKKRKKRLLTVSLANFNGDQLNESSKTTVDKNDDQSESLNCRLEKSILEQILYSSDRSHLSNSRIKRIDDKRRLTPLWFALLIPMLICSVIACVLEYRKVLPDSTGNWFYPLVGIALILAIALLWLMFRNHMISKLAVNEVEIEISNCQTDKILNHFIDEILYFFQKKKTEIVVIEDLDRFDNTDIFSKLRELNYLINNSSTVPQKVTFIYCVKDDLFYDETERAKFFDYIISLVPIMSYANARDVLKKMMDRCPQEMRLPTTYIQEISHFVTEMRVLKNIVNDYIVYYHLLKVTDMKEPDKNIGLFSLMLYKNLRPKDFAELQFGRGKLAQIFLDNQVKTVQETAIIQGKINEIEHSLGELDNEYISTFENLKSLVFGVICRKFSSRSRSLISYNDLNDLTTFESINGITVTHYHSHYASLNEIESIIGFKLFDYEKRIKQSIEDRKNRLQKELRELRTIFYSMPNYSVKEFLQYKGKHFSNEDMLIEMLLKNGYISENYKTYISQVGQDIISVHDQELIQNIISKRPVPVSQHFENPIGVIKDLLPARFTDKYILCYELVKTLLNNTFTDENTVEKQQYAIYFLCSGNANDFIIQYLQDIEIEPMVKALVPRYTEFAKLVIKSSLSLEIKNQTIAALFNTQAMDIVKKQNQDDCIATFIGTQRGVVEIYTDLVGTLIQTVIAELGISLQDIVCGTTYYEIARGIVSNNRYQINRKNLEFIVFNLNGCSREHYQNSVYTPILEGSDENLKDYLSKNMPLLIDAILENSNSKEGQAAIEVILNSKTDQGRKITFIEKLNGQFSYFASISPDLLKKAYQQNKIVPIWNNLVQSVQDQKLILKSIPEYIEKNANSLVENTLVDSTLIYQLCILPLNEKTFDKLSDSFNAPIPSWQDFPDDRVAVLIRKGKIEVNESNVQFLRAKPFSLIAMLQNVDESIDWLSNFRHDSKICGILLHSDLSLGKKEKILSYWGNDYTPPDRNAVLDCMDILKVCNLDTTLQIRLTLLCIKNVDVAKVQKEQLLLEKMDMLEDCQIKDCLNAIGEPYASFWEQSGEKIADDRVNDGLMQALRRKGILRYIYRNSMYHITGTK